MTKKKEDKPVKEQISLQNYAIKNNVTDMILAGFKTHLKSRLEDLHDENELDKSYKKYLETPGFITKEE